MHSLRWWNWMNCDCSGPRFGTLAALVLFVPYSGCASSLERPQRAMDAELARLLSAKWPFGPEEARRRQRDAASYVGVGVTKRVRLSDTVGIDFVLIPPGTLMMGPGEDREYCLINEGPRRSERVAKAFYLSTVEVTQAMWRAVMVSGATEGKPGNGAVPWKGRKYVRGPEFPATYTTWLQARDFCERLSRRVGWTVRLPSEVEWEYACRAGSAGRFCYGDDPNELAAYAWFDEVPGAQSDQDAHPQMVAQKKPNAWGLFDMHGNVDEFCLDRYQPVMWIDGRTVPEPGHGEMRVVRGGNFSSDSGYSRCCARRGVPPDWRSPFIGFRIVLELPPAAR